MSRRQRTRAFELSLAALTLGLTGVGAGAGCGGGQTPLNLFNPDWISDQGRSIESVRVKLQGARPPLGADVAVAVAGDANRVIGLHLGDHGDYAKWTFDHPLDTRPIVTGQVVVVSGGGELLALEATSGKKLWARNTGGLEVHGAGDDGAITVVSMAMAAGEGSVLLAVQHDGSVVRQIETKSTLGAPAVLDGFAFVPWGNQYLSALDLANGDEAGRAVIRGQVSRAWTSGEGLYFGELGIFRFDEHTKDSTSGEATHVDLPVRSLPGDPKLMTPGTERLGPVAGAVERIRLYARPSGPEGPLSLDSDRYYATYFRLVMGFDALPPAVDAPPSDAGAKAKTDAAPTKVAWVHTHASDVLGGAAGEGYLALCDADGRVTTLDAKTGGVSGEAEFGEPIRSCVVQVERYKPDREPAPVGSLAEQISRAIVNRESELATVQLLLLHELSTLPDEVATKTLIELASDPRTSPALLDDARHGLAGRRNGAHFMLEALARHYDFLKDVLRPPPVGPLAQALAAMKDNRAAPLLAEHLLDPADTDEDVRRAAEALSTLGAKSEASALKQFVGLYRASAPNDDVAAAVGSAAKALVRTSGDEGRALVREALSDPFTNEDVRDALQGLDLKPEKSETPAKPAASPAGGPSSASQKPDRR